MKYRFLSVHSLVGVHCPVDGASDICLAKYSSLKGEVRITPDIDQYMQELDEGLAIAYMALRSMIGQEHGNEFEERLKVQVGEIRERRRKEHAGNAFIVFTALGEIVEWNPKYEHEIGNRVVAFEAVPKGLISNKYQSVIRTILASFLVGCQDVCGFKNVGEGAFFIDDKGRTVHQLRMEVGSPEVIAYRHIQHKTLDHVKELLKKRKLGHELDDPGRLLNLACDRNSDSLLAFLAAWTGLEMFTKKVFKAYEASLFQPTAGASTPLLPPKVAERVRVVMKDKWKLTDKFLVVSSALSPADYAVDAANFRKIKKTRDDMFHAQTVDKETLPTEDTQRLLRKYIGLRMLCNKA